MERIRILNRKKNGTIAVGKLMGPDHHRVFMYIPGLSVSNQEVVFRRQTAIELCSGYGKNNSVLLGIEMRCAFTKKIDSCIFIA
jgi:hypothetical protein